MTGKHWLLGSILTVGSAALAACSDTTNEAGSATSPALQPSEINVAELGPQVGEIVPDFSLPDQYGEIWTRDSIMGPRGAMLVFVRSADW